MTIDINKIATDLNGKADVDLTNVVGAMSESAKNYFSGAGMPSSNYIDLTLGTSGTGYTAPENGWFCARGKATATSNSFIYLGCPETNIHTQCNGDGFVGTNKYIYLPVKKGNVVYLGYNSISDGTIQFIYAQGEQ